MPHKWCQKLSAFWQFHNALQHIGVDWEGPSEAPVMPHVTSPSSVVFSRSRVTESPVKKGNRSNQKGHRNSWIVWGVKWYQKDEEWQQLWFHISHLTAHYPIYDTVAVNGQAIGDPPAMMLRSPVVKNIVPVCTVCVLWRSWPPCAS